MSGRHDERSTRVGARGFGQGDRLGRYLILDPLGRGGMGIVYTAYDTALDRKVAIKVLRTDLGGVDEARMTARLRREAQAMARLAHPNVIAVHDVGTFEHAVFIAMELVDGMTLSRWLATPRSWKEIVAIFVMAGRGLAAAHAAGMIHRDFKPTNVLVGRDGRARVTDFGIARAAANVAASEIHTDLPDLDARPTSPPTMPETREGDQRSNGPLEHGPRPPAPNRAHGPARRPLVDPLSTPLTETGAKLGTVGYMAPEQVFDVDVDVRADQFAFCVSLYIALFRAKPFSDDSLSAYAAALGRGVSPPPPETSVPSEIRAVVLRGLRIDPAERYPSMDALLDELSRETSDPPSTSVAVRPFLDLSGAHDEGHLADGVAEEIITALTQIDGVRVAARSASFALRSPEVDARTVGARLGVDSVLEGSVRRAGNRLRVTVQLIDVRDGYQRWSQRFDGAVVDVFGMQDEIASGVAGALRGMLTAREQKALRRPEADLEAYDLFLRARQLLRNLSLRSLAHCQHTLERAIATDASYAPAYALLAQLHVWRGEWIAFADGAAAAEGPSKRALELGPHLAETHLARAQLHALCRRYGEAARDFEASIAIAPNSFDAHYQFGRAAFAAGDDDRALRLFQRAGEIQVEDFQAPLLQVMVLERLGRHHDAAAVGIEGVRRAERLLALDPDNVRALALGAPALIRLGRKERAFEWAARARSLSTEDPSVLVNLACLYALGGMKEEAFATLDHCVSRGYGNRGWIEHDPDFNSLRHDARFGALLAKMP